MALELEKIEGEVIPQENCLAVIIEESGLEVAKAQVLLEKFQDFFLMAADWERKAKAIVVTDASQRAEMEMARAGRLFLKSKRNEVEKIRKVLKEQSLREGKAIDGIANVLKALIVPTEEYLDKQERFVELRDAAEKYRLRLIAEQKAEEERLAKEAADKAEQERIRLENEQLKREAEVREAAAAEERRQAEEKLQAERKAAAEQLDAEKKKAEAIRAEESLQAAKKIAEAEQQLAAERRAAKEREEKLKAEIECPFCHKKFSLKKEGEDE